MHLPVAQDVPHQVHVAGGVRGRDVLHELAGGLLAALAEVGGVLQVGLLLGRGVRRGVHRLGCLDRLVGAAADALAGRHAAWVPAHQVVPLVQRGNGVGVGRQRGDAGAPGAAEVEQQGADAVVAARPGPDQREIDRLAIRTGPVQWRLERRAPPVAVRRRGVVGALAAGPVERLGRQCLRYSGRGRRRGRRAAPAPVVLVPVGRTTAAARGQQCRGGRQSRPPRETRHVLSPLASRPRRAAEGVDAMVGGVRMARRSLWITF